MKNINLLFGVTQGSCIDPVAFQNYFSALYDNADKFSMIIHGFTGKNKFVLSFKSNNISHKHAIKTMG